MAQQNTMTLDDETQVAAQQLARFLGCSVPEAIRRAVLRQRGTTVGTAEGRNPERRQTLERLVELFDGHDAEAEIRRLKAEDGP